MSDCRGEIGIREDQCLSTGSCREIQQRECEQAFGTIRRQYYPDARIIQEGDPAEATITRIWQTRVRVNNRFGIGMELDVRRPGYSPYTARTRTLVGILNVSKFEVGKIVPVKVDPNRPERVYLDMLS